MAEFIMAHISIRVSDEEKKLMESYAQLQGTNLSEAIKKAFFEKLEDEYDLSEYDRAMSEYKKNPVTYSHDEIGKILGLK
jgi:chorismate mutase